jgi:hypothetical protein
MSVRLPSLDPHHVWGEALAQYQLLRVGHALIRLDVLSSLEAGPLDVDELAQRTRTHLPSLRRLLRAAVTLGILDRLAGNRVSLGALARPLTNGDSSLTSAVVEAIEARELPRDGLYQSVRSGRAAFELLHGGSYFESLQPDAGAAAAFDARMARGARHRARALLEAAGLEGGGVVVDVGGGNGALLAEVLKANPRSSGVLFDVPETVRRARDNWPAPELLDRVAFVGGDFFRSIPPGGDVYVLAFIVHDWTDDKATAILRRCREVMSPAARLLIVEHVSSDDGETPVEFLKLDLLERFGAGERTAGELRGLLRDAGLDLTRMTGDLPFRVLEARSAGDQLASQT